MAAAGVAKLIEECGELQQVLGKKLAWWNTEEPHWDGSVLRERMAEEMGDVMAAIVLVATQFDLHDAVDRRTEQKVDVFFRWAADEGNNEHGIDASPEGEET
jgi:NTP pyrophosphatase (non-canonical NTP hydrolase)